MMKGLMLGMVFIGVATLGNVAVAKPTKLNNTELASTVLPAAEEQPAEPVLQKPNSSGQIGGVEIGTSFVPTIPQPALGTPAEPSRVANNDLGGITFTGPAAALNGQLSNLPLRNIYVQH